MSVTNIPVSVRMQLWGRAAGRCQYEGCNEPLWLDALTKSEFNTSYIAHIIADSPDGPRGDKFLSEKLEKDISNLMLMCDVHHRLIDRQDIDGHPVERLREMKRKHEQRIEVVTSILDSYQSHVLLYGANIGQHQAPVSYDRATSAMIPGKYPAEKPAIELGIGNSMFHDHESVYWQFERENLRRQFYDKVKPRLSSGDIVHMSVFALAPQPLLIELGRLISDISVAEVYQLHREPSDWKWQDHPSGFEYLVGEPAIACQKVALNLSLSGTIDNSRITNVLGEDTSIWTMTIETPNNDFLKSREQLRMFRETFRKLMNKIKTVHGQDNEIHIFPAVPVAIAVEIGRVWMPKADLPLVIYDENRQNGGFAKTFDILSGRDHNIA